MTPPKKTCFLVTPTPKDMPEGMSAYDYAVEQHDPYMATIAKSLCGVAGTEHFNPLPGIWMLNGYDDWAGVLQDAIKGAELKYSAISTQDRWLTRADSQRLGILSLLITITDRQPLTPTTI